MYSEQETFNMVVAGLRAQEWRKSSAGRDRFGGAACKYRGPNGLKCAAGHLIPDEQYSPDLEGGCVDELVRRVPALRLHNMALVVQCQTYHDWSKSPEDMEAHFKRLAARFGLEFPEAA